MKLAQLFGPPAGGKSRIVARMLSQCQELLSQRGEVSGRQTASEILASYESLDSPARSLFFDGLLKTFSPVPDEIGRAGDAYRQDPSPSNLAYLQRVVEPPRQELFRRLNMAPGATRVILEMRKHLLQARNESRWAPISADLVHLLASWFNRGFLTLRRIDWNTSATILEKLIQYEAVHQIQGWNDLRRRLESDRRCYAFFHPALPDEPIVFVEAALTRGMSDKVQPLLDPDSPLVRAESADCAVFYSITNCQEGLRGVPFGSFLLKQVVEDLSGEFPRLRRFATLSPVPGFRQWVEDNIPKVGQADLERTLVPLCALYLMRAKQGQEPLDPVARFHLRNGARLERINWLGDTSKIGVERSFGIMVNYIYRLADLERNHESYAKQGKVAASAEIESMARRAATARPN